jgi:ribosomal protein S7
MTTRTQSAGKKRKTRRLVGEAFKTVEERANDIVEALMKATLECKVMSTKLLVELAEGDVDVEDALNKKPLRSLALRLANEPQVVDATMHKVLETDAYRTEIVQG